jgi:hypothetical protein
MGASLFYLTPDPSPNPCFFQRGASFDLFSPYPYKQQQANIHWLGSGLLMCLSGTLAEAIFQQVALSSSRLSSKAKLLQGLS